MIGPAPAILTIDLDAVAANYRLLAGRLAPGCAMTAVVKGDAYGLGALPVVRRLAGEGCRRFFVATVPEALELAQAQIGDIEIAVLDGVDDSDLEAVLRHAVLPVLSAPSQVRLWQAQGQGRPALIQLDSGMSRLGLSAAEIADLAASGGFDGYPVDTVMSHLACSDTPEHPQNQQQKQQFDALVALLPSAVRATARLSLAASGGIFLGPAFHYGLVRPGAALWGLNPAAAQPNPMRQTVGLKAKIIQVLAIDAGRSVGYGAAHVAVRPQRIATVGIGYADGYPRAAGNRARAYIGDRPLPVLGRVSMDLLTLDASDLPEHLVQPGGFVDLLGPHYGPDDLARDSDTIGYEVLTRLSRRLHRSYQP